MERKRDELYLVLASQVRNRKTGKRDIFLTFNMGDGALYGAEPEPIGARSPRCFTVGQSFDADESAASCAAKLRQLADDLELEAKTPTTIPYFTHSEGP